MLKHVVVHRCFKHLPVAVGYHNKKLKETIYTIFKVKLNTLRPKSPPETQQKNMELDTLSFNLGSRGTGGAPADVNPPRLEDVSDMSSNFMNCPT